MTPDATPRIVSRHIHERQTAPSTAPVPKARPWRRGQAPKPHSGAPKAQGLTAAIAVAAPSLGPSIEPDNPVSLNATGANAPMNAFATSQIYTSLTDATTCSVSPATNERCARGDRASRSAVLRLSCGSEQLPWQARDGPTGNRSSTSTNFGRTIASSGFRNATIAASCASKPRPDLPCRSVLALRYAT